MSEPASVPFNLQAFLRSPKLTLILLLALAVLISMGTLPIGQALPGTGTAGKATALYAVAKAVGLVEPFHSTAFMVLLFLLAANVAFCTVRRLRLLGRGASPRGLRCRSAADLLVHLSVLVIIAGGVVKGMGEVVLTQNIHLGARTETAYDWALAADAPLGFSVAVEEFVEDFYPGRVQIGVSVLASGKKFTPLEVREGQESPLAGSGLEISIAGFDTRRGQVLGAVRKDGGDREPFTLEIAEGGRTTTTLGLHAFTLVAYQRELRSVRFRVAIREGSRIVREGWLGLNQPLSHRGLGFHQTAWGRDEFGNVFVGIQFVRDPGAPLFWVGCVMMSLALPLFLYCRHRPTARTGAEQAGDKPLA